MGAAKALRLDTAFDNQSSSANTSPITYHANPLIDNAIRASRAAREEARRARSAARSPIHSAVSNSGGSPRFQPSHSPRIPAAQSPLITSGHTTPLLSHNSSPTQSPWISHGWTSVNRSGLRSPDSVPTAPKAPIAVKSEHVPRAPVASVAAKPLPTPSAASISVKTEDSPQRRSSLAGRKRSREDIEDVSGPSTPISSTRAYSNPVSSTPGSSTPVSSTDTSSRWPIPTWYQQARPSNTRTKAMASEDAKLDRLKNAIRRCYSSSDHELSLALDSLAESMHDAIFASVTGQLLRNKSMLNAHGTSLSSIFTNPASYPRFPAHLSSDAEELWTKWAMQDFDTDLLRGIKYVRDQALSLKPGYSLKRRADIFGSNTLVNGQWWPYQMCLVRDGAHGLTQGGVYGRRGEGAYSIVLSTGDAGDGTKYPDHDAGETLRYCGTDGKGGEVSENTQHLLDSCEKGRAVRVIRSAQCEHSAYAPEAGFRFDGMYRITGFELLDEEKARHRFNMVREEGQDEIRYRGAGKRPTRQELAAYRELVRNKKFVVNES